MALQRGVSFVVSMILARLIAPEAYGTIGLVVVITTILKVFVESGFGASIIHGKEVDEIDYSTVFIFNGVFCIILYILLFFASPALGRFYDMPEIVSVFRILGLSIVISAFSTVPMAINNRVMNFRNIFIASLSGSITSAIVGITMAYKGYGVWALVAQDLINSFVSMIIIWLFTKKFKLVFKKDRFVVLFKYGWKILFVNLYEKTFANLRALLIGKIYSPTDLAYYDKGGKIPDFFVAIIDSTINSVFFPVLSKEQSDESNLLKLTRLTIRFSAFIIFPIMGYIAVCSKSIVVFLLTEKWLPIIPYFRIACISSGIAMIGSTNLNTFKALKSGNAYLYINIIAKIVALVLLVLSLSYGPVGIAWSMAISYALCEMIYAIANKKLLSYGFRRQIMDIVPFLVITILTMVSVSWIPKFVGSHFFVIAFSGILGLGVYMALAKLFKVKELDIVLNVVLNKKEG